MGAVAMDPDIRVVYDGLDQDDGTVDSPPPPHVASEAEQNDELQPTDQ